MWKEIKNSVYSFLALYVLSCFVAFVVTGAALIAVLFLPIAFLVVLSLVIKEMLQWKKKKGNSYIPVEDMFTKKDPAVKVLDERFPAVDEWMNGTRPTWSYYWHNDRFTFNH